MIVTRHRNDYDGVQKIVEYLFCARICQDFEENKTKIIESFWAPAIYTSKENCSYVSQSEASGVAAPHGAWSCKISAS